MVDRLLSNRVLESLQSIEKESSPEVRLSDDLLEVVAHFAVKMEESKYSLNNESGPLFTSWQQSDQWKREFEKMAKGKDLQGADFDEIVGLALSAHDWVIRSDNGTRKVDRKNGSHFDL